MTKRVKNLVGQNRGQVFGLGDEVKIQVAGVNLEERKIDFQLIKQITHAGRVVRSRAPRTTKTTAQANEEVFSKPTVSSDGERPVHKKKEKK